MTKEQAEKVAKASVDASYKLKSLGTKKNTFVFHANNDNVIPSDVIIAVNKESGKTGASMFSVEEAAKMANR